MSEMTSIFAICLFIFAVCASRIVNGDIYPFCSSAQSNFYGPKLPTFPEAFEATVEVNIVDRNYSVLYTEFYDKNANKGALRKVKNGTSTYTIYNYNEDEMMVIDEGNRRCSLQEISTMHGFPFFGRNGSKIDGMADLFRFGGSFNETFIGKDTVRGIPCFHWQTCINHQNYSYTVDYYFSIPTWSMAHGTGNMQVVRSTINGTTTRAYHSRESLPTNTSRSFYHVYDFFSFKPGPPQPSAFEVPRGVFCAGMKDRKPLPEMKSVFSLEIERMTMNNKTVSHIKEYYDIDRNVAMLQFYNYHHHNYGETRIVHDFTHDVVYRISGSVCQNVSQLLPNNTWWDSKETADHHIRMKTSSEVLFSNNISALVYTGSSTVRGIDADVWIMEKEQIWKRSRHVVKQEYYFSKRSWNMRAGSLGNQSQVILRIDSYDPLGHRKIRMNIFNYDAEAVPLSVFDINPCFIGNRAIISIKIEGTLIKEISKYEIHFSAGVRESIAKAARVSNLRVENIWNGKSSKYVQIWFTLLGKPPITSPDVKVVENNLTQAIEALRKAVQGGDLEITWTGSDQRWSAKAEKFFFDSMSPDNPTPVNPTDDKRGKKKSKRGVPGGAVAGIAFLMLAVGVCVGLGIAHIIMKRRGTSLFQYQRHE